MSVQEIARFMESVPEQRVAEVCDRLEMDGEVFSPQGPGAYAIVK